MSLLNTDCRCQWIWSRHEFDSIREGDQQATKTSSKVVSKVSVGVAISVLNSDLPTFIELDNDTFEEVKEREHQPHSCDKKKRCRCNP